MHLPVDHITIHISAPPWGGPQAGGEPPLQRSDLTGIGPFTARSLTRRAGASSSLRLLPQGSIWVTQSSLSRTLSLIPTLDLGISLLAHDLSSCSTTYPTCNIQVHTSLNLCCVLVAIPLEPPISYLYTGGIDWGGNSDRCSFPFVFD